jgi:hypothetical protein
MFDYETVKRVMQRSFDPGSTIAFPYYRPATFYENRRNLSAAMRDGGLRLTFSSLRVIRQASCAEGD